MRTISFLSIALFLLVATASAAWAHDGDCNSVADFESVIENDRDRIQAHFVEVEAELRSRDVSHLSAELREARTRNLDELLDYREAGEFPHNTYVSHRQPVFIDGDDRRCAVGHLMIESGFEDEARRISERENLAYLLEMESPEVEEWVAQSGLTAEEAAWIQPGYSSCYDGCSCDVQPVCGDDGRTYVNPCYAQACGGVERWVKGCCADGDEIANSRDGEFGFIQTACASDPNEDRADYCPVGDSITDPEEDDWEYPEEDDNHDHDGDTGDQDGDTGETSEGDHDDYDPDEPACSGVASSPLSSGPALAILAMLLIFGVRRGRRGHQESRPLKA